LPTPKSTCGRAVIKISYKKEMKLLWKSKKIIVEVKPWMVNIDLIGITSFRTQRVRIMVMVSRWTSAFVGKSTITLYQL